METTYSHHTDHGILTLGGRLDAMTSAAFDAQVQALSTPLPPLLVFDCAGLEYLSSAGLRSMLLAAKRMKAAGGRLVCVGLQGTAREVFEMSGFRKVIPLFDDTAAALAAS